MTDHQPCYHEHTTSLVVQLVFGLDSDLDLVTEELSKAGYTVHRMPHNGPSFHPLGDDLIEAVIPGSDDEKIVDAVWREVGDIADRHDGLLWSLCPVDSSYIPFDPNNRNPW